MNKFVAYYRVSSAQQGASGLGLEAQRSAVLKYLKGEIPVMDFTDVETGTKKGNDRVGLQKALKYCREHSAKLIIAKLDRLARNVSFISKLMESEVEFIATDLPTANKFTLHIFAALAEQEALFISERTKSALAEAKKRGKKLGSPQNLTREAQQKGVEAKVQKAKENDNNKKALALINLHRKNNLSYRKIADELNNAGFLTSKGKSFSGSQVFTLYERCTQSS
ncbi:recombinase family protein [Chryseobacterium sp. G0201]|uniref:recombinase family protein n=1 Tax=Chryseobacterium sp. G0201 TaxID=2487065 RepID=UPI000F4E2A49|nr:recombinase family protein [Chryseobacterium sp. G0201]AZA51552.1 recombinase family protein [Chryseobacterium sp. G0201]